jgi:hypothetical protein
VLEVNWSWSQAWLTYLVLRPREVVGRFEGTGDTLLDGRIATVVGAQNRVLEAAGVLDVHVDLAILAVLNGLDIGTNRRSVGVEDERHDGPVRRDLVAHGARRAAGSTIGDTADGNLDVSELELEATIVVLTCPGGGASPRLTLGSSIGEAATRGRRARSHFILNVMDRWVSMRSDDLKM